MFAPAIAFVDLETTGTVATRDRITEIGIVRVHDGELVEEWSTLVNPGCPIPEEIQALTGITNAMVRGAPAFESLRREVFERLDGHLFVAHNARFDYGFLKNEFRRLEMPFTADVLCTVRLSRRLFPEAVGHGLDALIERHRLADAIDPDRDSRAGRHSALGDARVLWRFVQRLYHEKEVADIAAAVKRLLKIPSLPPQLPPDALEPPSDFDSLTLISLSSRKLAGAAVTPQGMFSVPLEANLRMKVPSVLNSLTMPFPAPATPCPSAPSTAYMTKSRSPTAWIL